MVLFSLTEKVTPAVSFCFLMFLIRFFPFFHRAVAPKHLLARLCFFKENTIRVMNTHRTNKSSRNKIRCLCWMFRAATQNVSNSDSCVLRPCNFARLFSQGDLARTSFSSPFLAVLILKKKTSLSPQDQG